MPAVTERTETKLIQADSRGRVALGSSAIAKSFTVSHSEDGQIILTPMAQIPEREMWLWNNQVARLSFERGIAEAKTGQGVVMDFSGFLEEGDTEDIG